jgi:hypothetical protein
MKNRSIRTLFRIMNEENATLANSGSPGPSVFNDYEDFVDMFKRNGIYTTEDILSVRDDIKASGGGLSVAENFLTRLTLDRHEGEPLPNYMEMARIIRKAGSL